MPVPPAGRVLLRREEDSGGVPGAGGGGSGGRQAGTRPLPFPGVVLGLGA